MVVVVVGHTETMLRFAVAGGMALAAAYLYHKRRRVNLTLGYWKIRGLAAPARMMLAYAKAEGRCDFEDCAYELHEKEGGGYDNSSWMKNAKPGLKERNALINLPYVIDHSSGLVVTQSTAVFQFIARKVGLLGSCERAVAECEQTLAEALDLRNATMKLVYPFSGINAEDYPSKLVEHLAKVFTGHATKFESFLGGRSYFAGEELTAGDFHVWEMLDQHALMAKRAGLPAPLAQYPKLAAFHARVAALPQLAAYFESPEYGYIVNNKMANFK